jgi:hypothetical protein
MLLTHCLSIYVGIGSSSHDFDGDFTKSFLISSLDAGVSENYRLVSNLPFVSEIIEKVVASRIEDHFDKHKLHDNRQSAYRSFHSTFENMQ